MGQGFSPGKCLIFNLKTFFWLILSNAILFNKNKGLITCFVPSSNSSYAARMSLQLFHSYNERTITFNKLIVLRNICIDIRRITWIALTEQNRKFKPLFLLIYLATAMKF